MRDCPVCEGKGQVPDFDPTELPPDPSDESVCYCQEVEAGTKKRCPTHMRVPCCMTSMMYGRGSCECYSRREVTKTGRVVIASTPKRGDLGA